MGLGGGSILLLCLRAGGVEQLPAQGANLALVVPVGLLGLWFHRKRGLVEWRTALLMALGGLGGIWMGAWAAGWLPEHWLRRMFGALVTVIGVRELLGGIRQLKNPQDGSGKGGKEKELSAE